MRYVNSADAPKFPPLCQASVNRNGLVEVAGQVGVILGTNPPRLEATAFDQTTLAMRHVGAILREAGSSVHNIGRVSILHTSPDDGPEINAAYLKFLDDAGIDPDQRPPRAMTGASSLPLGALVEIITTAETI